MDINSKTERIRDAYKNYPGNPDPLNYKPHITFGLLAILTYVLTLGIYNPTVIERLIVFVPISGILLFLVTLVDREEEINNQDEIYQMYLYFVIFNATMISSYTIFVLFTLVSGFLQAEFVIQLAESLVGTPVTATAYYNIYILYDISTEILTKESEDNSGKNSKEG